MRQNDLRPPKGAHRDRKRVGRGYGSGRGKTAGRGTKGQKARSNPGIRVGFEGGQNPLIQRMPFKRGFTNPNRVEYEIVNVRDLTAFEAGTELTPEVLLELGLVDRPTAQTKPWLVKVLGEGDLPHALHVKAHRVSKGARAKIEAAGGTVEELLPRKGYGNAAPGDTEDSVVTPAPDVTSPTVGASVAAAEPEAIPLTAESEQEAVLVPSAAPEEVVPGPIAEADDPSAGADAPTPVAAVESDAPSVDLAPEAPAAVSGIEPGAASEGGPPEEGAAGPALQAAPEAPLTTDDAPGSAEASGAPEAGGERR